MLKMDNDVNVDFLGLCEICIIVRNLCKCQQKNQINEFCRNTYRALFTFYIQCAFIYVQLLTVDSVVRVAFYLARNNMASIT